MIRWLGLLALLASPSFAFAQTFTEEDAGRESLEVTNQYFARIISEKNRRSQQPGWFYGNFIIPNPGDGFALAVEMAYETPGLGFDLGIGEFALMTGAQAFVLPREPLLDAVVNAGLVPSSDISASDDEQFGMSAFAGVGFYSDWGYVQGGVNAVLEGDSLSSELLPFVFTNIKLLSELAAFFDISLGDQSTGRIGTGLDLNLGLFKSELEAWSVVAGVARFRRILANQSRTFVSVQWVPEQEDPELKLIRDSFELVLGNTWVDPDGDFIDRSFGDGELYWIIEGRLGGFFLGIGDDPVEGFGWRAGFDFGAAGISLQNDYLIDRTYGAAIPGTTFFVYYNIT